MSTALAGVHETGPSCHSCPCGLTRQHLTDFKLVGAGGVCTAFKQGSNKSEVCGELFVDHPPGVPAGPPADLIEFIQVQHVNIPNAFDESSATYEVTRMDLPGLRGKKVDPIQLYMRQEAKDLWKCLEQSPDNAIIMINGCPGVGISVVVFAQTLAQCRSEGKSLLYHHRDQKVNRCFVMDKQGSVSIVETNDITNFALQERVNYDVTVVDGAFRDYYLEDMFMEFPEDKKLIFCTSYQAIDLKQEAESIVEDRLIEHTVCSWTLEDYRRAADADCLPCVESGTSDADREAIINSRFSLCGGSIRWFNRDQDRSRAAIHKALRVVNNYKDLFRNFVGPSSASAVNRLMSLYRSTDEPYVMSVPLSRYVFDQLAARCKNEQYALVEFIGDARMALPNNPSWQGWVTELEVISILKLHGRLELFTNDAGTEQLTLDKSVLLELRKDEACPKYVDCKPHTWILPYKWHQALWDAVHIVGNKVVEIVQVTSGEKHTHKFGHLPELLVQLQPQPKNRKIRVHFLTICRQTNFLSLAETNVGLDNLSSNIDITVTKVWYRELRHMTNQSSSQLAQDLPANETSLSAQKRKRPSTSAKEPLHKKPRSHI